MRNNSVHFMKVCDTEKLRANKFVTPPILVSLILYRGCLLIHCEYYNCKSKKVSSKYMNANIVAKILNFTISTKKLKNRGC